MEVGLLKGILTLSSKFEVELGGIVGVPIVLPKLSSGGGPSKRPISLKSLPCKIWPKESLKGPLSGRGGGGGGGGFVFWFGAVFAPGNGFKPWFWNGFWFGVDPPKPPSNPGLPG